GMQPLSTFAQAAALLPGRFRPAQPYCTAPRGSGAGRDLANETTEAPAATSRRRKRGGPGSGRPPTKTRGPRRRLPPKASTGVVSLRGSPYGGLRKGATARGGGSARGLRQRPVRPL